MISNLLFIQSDSVVEAVNNATETVVNAAPAVTEQSFDLLSMAAKGGFLMIVLAVNKVHPCSAWKTYGFCLQGVINFPLSIWSP